MSLTLVNIGTVLLAICTASAQDCISASGTARGKADMRIIQDAAEAALIEGEFDPFTAGLLDGLQKNLEDEMETGPSGDRDLALMLSTNLSWLIAYRIDHDHHDEPLHTEIVQWHDDCTHEINVALRRGVAPRFGGACRFTEVKFKKLHPNRKNK